MIKNLKLKIKNLKLKRGFTLIELLVVMVVIFAVGSIIVGIIFSSLRGANKANSIDNARRNGNYAIEQMSRMIRYARTFNGVSICDPSDTVNCHLIATCVPATITPTPAPATYNYIEVTGFDNGQTIFTCLPYVDATHLGKIASNSSQLVDTSTVMVTACTITCQQSSIVSPPTVTINFSLKNNTGGNFTENQAPVTFQTSATFRNY